MARDLSQGAQLASPNQAATLFNPDGRHPVRQKHLFVVRFLRETQTEDSGWRDGLSFVVKSMDRPQIQPVVEELNQYNKKRLIHTGVKYQPVNCTFYDTADGAAMNMWIQYARYYFGDYHHTDTDYMDDIINAELLDATTDKRGYGFNIRQGATNEGINSQHFFSKVVVYQVWGNEYTSYELLNPRINAFNPDDLTYDSGEASTIQVTLTFEAINHGNTGRPQDLFSEQTLKAMFADGEFKGNTVEVLGPARTTSFVSTAPADVFPATPTGTGTLQTETVPIAIDRTTTSSDGGVLARFGQYDWGSTPRNQFDAIEASLPLAIGGSSDLANLLSGNFSGGARLASRITATQDIESAVGQLAIQNIPGLVEGLRDASYATGLSPREHASRSNGLSLSNVALDGTNRTSDGTLQLGQRNLDPSGFDTPGI